jgi:hypothetical protein
MKQRILAFLAALLLLPGLAQAKIFLVDTNDTLRVVTASGVSTIHMYAAWADLTTTALTPGASNAQVTTATTTVLVAAPGASTQRQIKGLSIRNSHASSSNVITVQFFDGATATELIQYTLLAGETLQWGEDENFRIIDASGQVKGLVALATGTNSVGQVTANAGTNLNTSALLTTTAHDAAFGTAGTADSQVRTVQGIASMTPLLVNPGTATNFGVYAEDSAHASGDNLVLAGVVRSDAAAALAADGDRTVLQVDANGYLKVVNINPNLAADNSTLSTAKVPVLAGTVSTAAPTWTTGNQSALSLQTDGSVRSAVTNTVTVTASNLDVQIGGSDSLTIGTFPDNEPFNVAQINGVTPLMGAGNTGTGSLRVTVATDQAALPGMGVYVEDAAETAGGNLSMAGTVRRDTAASSAGASGDNATVNTDALGLLWTRGLDPCTGVAKQYLPINISTATTTEITASLAGASNHYYVCSINIGPVAAAQNLALVDDDSDGCGSVTSGLAGGTTAGSGWNIAANGGLTMGNGLGSIARTGGTNRVLCLVSSAAVQTSGVITVVAAP